jgi:hypothetical protein
MKQMYYLLEGLAIIFVVSFLLASCNKNEDIEKVSSKEISIDKTELIFTQKDESKELMIFCDDAEEWHLEAEGLERYIGPNGASAKDFTFAPAWGKGSSKLSIAMTNNLTEGYEILLYVVRNKDSQKAIVKLKAVAN